MKYLLDAQLSYKLAKHLKKKGFDVVHTNELPNKEKSTDKEISLYSKKHKRIVITKDSDFLDSYLIHNLPEKILLVTVGNLHNDILFILFDNYFYEIDLLFKNNNYIELNQNEYIIHE
jgi:predicted nuclease of predicted toxin-antitoxin system